MRLPLSIRSLVLLFIAILAGLLAAWAAGEHIQQRIDILENTARTPMVQRVVAARYLPEGELLGMDDLAVRDFPAAAVSSDSVSPEDFSALVGRKLQGALQAGDLVLPVHTTVLAESLPFSSRLASGRRAITMPVDALNSVSGLLEPGDLIDLYVSFDYRRRRMTVPLLQGVLVLATGVHSDPALASMTDSSAYSTVTLDTSPEDAVKLVAARHGGTITAILRRPDDKFSSEKAVRGDLASILGVAAPPPSSSSRKRAPVIYGNVPVRTLGSLQPGVTTVSQASGLFNLPYKPDLASAWMHSRDAAQDLGAESLVSYPWPSVEEMSFVDTEHLLTASEWPVDGWPVGSSANDDGGSND